MIPIIFRKNNKGVSKVPEQDQKKLCCNISTTNEKNPGLSAVSGF